jgi:ribonuclease P/MRP protein subunit POP5
MYQWLLVVALVGVSVFTSIYSYIVSRRLRILEKYVAELEKTITRISKWNKLVARAAFAALQSLEAEEFLRRLRAKRRRRYIAFYIAYEGSEPPSPQDVEKALLRAVERLGGQIAVALGGVQLVYYDPEKAAGIVRCTHDTKYIVLAAMGLVRRIGQQKAIIVPVRTTGTIKRAKKAIQEAA